MRKDLLNSAMKGLSFAGIAALIVRFTGFNQNTLMIFLYLYVIQAVYSPAKKYLLEYLDFAPGFLNRLVIVVEGEEIKMKKLLTGEKYRVDGEVEKL